MPNYFSERSTAIAKLAMESLAERLKLTYCEGDDPHIARALDEISVAINELGTFNNRTQVHYEGLKVSYSMYPPQADHIQSAICNNCNFLHVRLMTPEDTCFAEAVIDEPVGMGLIDSILGSLQKLRQRNGDASSDPTH